MACIVIPNTCLACGVSKARSLIYVHTWVEKDESVGRRAVPLANTRSSTAIFTSRKLLFGFKRKVRVSFKFYTRKYSTADSVRESELSFLLKWKTSKKTDVYRWTKNKNNSLRTCRLKKKQKFHVLKSNRRFHDTRQLLFVFHTTTGRTVDYDKLLLCR